jgi:hypothetical protein
MRNDSVYKVYEVGTNKDSNIYYKNQQGFMFVDNKIDFLKNYSLLQEGEENTA